LESVGLEQRGDNLGFNGAVVLNKDKVLNPKSIAICGTTRGGTSFAASVFARVGVPFAREGERHVSKRYENRALRQAFQAGNEIELRQLASDFSSQHDVWAWKLPELQQDLGLVARCLPNLHLVFILKEPLSVAARKSHVRGEDVVTLLQRVLRTYTHLANFAAETKLPLLMISYDRALARLDRFIPEVAEFAGVTGVDVADAITKVRHDGDRYFNSKESAEPTS
jgi:hypothetical protein